MVGKNNTVVNVPNFWGKYNGGHSRNRMGVCLKFMGIFRAAPIDIRSNSCHNGRGSRVSVPAFMFQLLAQFQSVKWVRV